MAKQIQLLVRIPLAPELRVADYTVVIASSPTLDFAAPTELKRFPATSPANDAGEIETTLTVDGDAPRLLAAQIYSEYHKEASPFGNPDFVPQVPPGSGISLRAQRIFSAA